MSKYLVKTTEQYRIDTEAEAKEFIERAKKSKDFSLVKYTNEVKTTKSKGEVIDEWRRVTLVKSYNDEKEPYDVYIEARDDIDEVEDA